jgi:N-methylhydantoinase A
MVDENMANAARVHAIESGKDARARTLIAFGGAAPLHAARVAEKLGISSILIPANAGVGSAVGFLRAPVAYEIVRSHVQRLGSFQPAAANRLLGEMRAEAEAIVRQGAGDVPLAEHRSAFMRYRGQGHEIAVTLPVRPYTEADAALLLAAFEDAYRALYSRIIPGVEVEVLSWVTVVSAPPDPVVETAEPETAYAPAAKSRRHIYDPATGEAIEVPIYWRGELKPGARITGPAVIAEDETSTVVSRLFDARIDGFGYIRLLRRGETR